MSGLFNNTLQLWQWAVLAAVPPLIVLLYFLKLKRRPVEVPSTYLWRRAIEDLHVNSIWQRIRRNVLLFLQLLLVALIMMAVLRPGCRGTTLVGDRFIFLIDTSASMGAKEPGGTRLELAKRRVIELVDQMSRGDVAMVISFSNEARIEQSFTDNRRLLRERVQRIQGTARPSDVLEALRAASGLANPGQSSEAGSPVDAQVAGALPATLYLVSDGGFQQVPEFALGNLEPRYVRIGAAAANVGIVAFTTERNTEKLDQVQAFARLENRGVEQAVVEASLYRGELLLDAQKVVLPAGGGGGVRFELRDPEPGVLRLAISASDALAVDNEAFAAINPRKPATVLCVTPGNSALQTALETSAAKRLATVTFVAPTFLEDPDYERRASAGDFDLVLYDRCAPKNMPLASTFFLGSVPPGEVWSSGGKVSPVAIIDVERSHPLVAMPDPTHVRIVEGFVVKGPKGARTLLDSQDGPLLAIAPRESFEDAVLGFTLVDADGKGGIQANTDWPRWYSFPVFWQNVLGHMAGGTQSESAPTVQPGETLAFRSLVPVETVRVRGPAEVNTDELRRSGQGYFQFGATDKPGLYSVYEGDSPEPSQWFAVNLFDGRETDLTPPADVTIGASQVTAASGGGQAGRRELWKWLLGAGVCVLVFEWYVYNRRVYL
ncbi:MAG: hypothetical protein RLY70_36 [Planctomycetota bacterium]|jgi:hypothetical protein